MSSEKLRKEAQKLLSSQLARITGILADAAKHRDELVKKKMGASRDGSESSGVQSPGPTIRSDKSTRGSLSSKRDEPTTANAREDVVQADWTSSPTNTSVGEDPRQVLVDMERERETMLAQVDRDSSSLTGTASHNDPLRLLAELDRHSQSIMTSLHSSDMLIDDIDSLRVEFESLRAGPRNNGGSASGISQRDGPDQRLDAFVTPTEQNGQCQPVPGAALGCPTVDYPRP